MYLLDRYIPSNGEDIATPRQVQRRRRAAEVVDKAHAPFSPCDEFLHSVGEGSGGVVDRQRLAGDGELEEPHGIDALALQPVEVLRQLTGLLVTVPTYATIRSCRVCSAAP